MHAHPRDQRAHRDRRTVHVAESQVMGRAAIAVVVVCVQPVALGQLLGYAQGSETLNESGQPATLATIWALTMVLGGAAMLGSYFVRRADDTRVLEMAASLCMGIVAALHLYIVLTVLGYSGGSYVVSTDAALVLNCCGLAFFRLRQLCYVAGERRRYKARRDVL